MGGEGRRGKLTRRETEEVKFPDGRERARETERLRRMESGGGERRRRLSGQRRRERQGVSLPVCRERTAAVAAATAESAERRTRGQPGGGRRGESHGGNSLGERRRVLCDSGVSQGSIPHQATSLYQEL